MIRIASNEFFFRTDQIAAAVPRNSRKGNYDIVIFLIGGGVPTVIPCRSEKERDDGLKTLITILEKDNKGKKAMLIGLSDASSRIGGGNV